MNGNTLPRPCTHHDLVVQTLALSESERINECREWAAESEAYRELAQTAVQKVADLTRQLERANATIIRLRDELTRYTAAAVVGRET